MKPLNIVRETLKQGYPEREFIQDLTPIPFEKPKERLQYSGEAALRKGQIAVLMPVGGLSTRMGSELRLALPVGPVTDRSILQLQLEKLLAVRERYNCSIPLIIVTSKSVHESTKALFERLNYCGLPKEEVKYISQPSMPVVNDNGDAVILPNGIPLEAPMGHGSIISAIRDSDVITWLDEQGVKYVFQFQYPNVMEKMCAPEFIGAHIMGGHEATLMAFDSSRSLEKVGRICYTKTGRLNVVEYHEIHAKLNLAWMQSLPANLGTYMWSLDFLNRCINEKIKLPLIAVRHQQPQLSDKMWKVEQFIFDLLKFAHTSGFVTVDREQQYGIVKNKKGFDSLEFAKKQLNQMYCYWLTKAGAVTEDLDVKVEISPLFALDQKELTNRIDMGFKYYNGLVLNRPKQNSIDNKTKLE